MSILNEIRINDKTTVLFNENEIRVNSLDSVEQICSDFCSKPQLSRKKDKIAFISPYEWEYIGELYIYSFKNRDMKILTKDRLPNQNTIKKIKWLNNEDLLLIIGWGYGTVSVGGNLYLYNCVNDELKIIVEKTADEEIKDFTVCGNEITLEVVQFSDNYIDYISRLESIVI